MPQEASCILESSPAITGDRLKHWSRLLIAVVVLVILLGATLGYHTLVTVDRELSQKTIQAWQERQAILADSAATGIEGVVTHWEHTLQNFSVLTDIIEMNAMGKRFCEVLIQDHPDTSSGISRMDRNGVITYSYPVPEAVGQDISSQPHIQQLIKTQKPVLSTAFNAVQGYRAFAYHYPIIKDGEFDGSIGVLIPFDKIANMHLEPIKPDPTSHVWLFDQNSNIIFSCDHDHIIGSSIKEVFGRQHPVLEHTYKKSGHDMERFSYDDISPPELYDYAGIMHAIGTSVQLGNSNWIFVVSTPESTILSEITAYRNRWITVLGVLLTIGFIILASIIAFMLYLRNLRRETEIREESTRKIRESEKKFRLLAENAQDMIFRFDLKTERFTYASPASTIITGYTPSEIYTKHHFFESIAHADSLKKIRTINNQLKQGVHSSDNEFQIIHKSGSVRWVSIRSVIIRDVEGNPAFVEGIVSDFSKSKAFAQALLEAKDKAESASRAKSEFLSMMSHELRTPLNPVVGFCDLLISEIEDEDQLETLHIMKSSSKHLLNIIGDIIDIASLESGKMEILYAPVELDSFFEQTLAPFRYKAKEKGLKLAFHRADADITIILSDANRLRQVINNLLSNAIKFTEEGCIEFEVEIEPLKRPRKSEDPHCTHLLTCTVTDTGVGIPEHKVDHIFEPFSQADTSNTRAYGGTGLGLSICKRIIKKFEGNIQHIKSPNKGSIFSFEIEVGIIREEDLD